MSLITGIVAFSGLPPPWQLNSLDANFTAIVTAVNALPTSNNSWAGTATFTNTVTITPVAGNALFVTSAAGAAAGVFVAGGTSGSDAALIAKNSSLANLFVVTGAGAIQGLGPVGAALVDMTPDKSSWVTTLSGPYSSNPTGTLKWERQGTQVTIWADSAITGTATSSAVITASALPASISPSTTRLVTCFGLTNNGSSAGVGTVSIGGSSLVIGFLTASGSYVTGANASLNSGGVGISAGWSITYSL